MGRWQKIIEYYRACISAENTADVKFRSADDGKTFLLVPAEKECISSGSSTLIVDERDRKFHLFMRGTQWNAAPTTYFYGFPRHVDRRGMVHPLIIFDVELEQAADGRKFVLQPNRPRPNLSWALGITAEEKRQAIEAFNESWDDSRSLFDNAAEVLRKWEEIFPHLDGDTLLHNPFGVLFHSIQSPFTQGLEQELAQLSTKTGLPNKVWGLILDRNGLSLEEDAQDILEITPLNDEQRQAMKSAFANTLTIVTGPPGTGKSQVILNVIINALQHNETVLFGSRNNKAVDVVVERLSRLQSRPIMLRYGNQDIEFAESLLQAVEYATAQNSEAIESEVRDYGEQLKRVRKEGQQSKETLARILVRRNRIEEIENTLESLKAELPYYISDHLKPYDEVRVGTTFIQGIDRTKRLIEEAENPNFITRILSLFGYPIEKRLSQPAQLLLADMPAYCQNLPVTSVDKVREVLKVADTLQKWVELQRESLDIARQNWEEPRLEILRARIENSQARAIEISVKLVDVLMMRRLIRLTPGERRAIVDYVQHLRALRNDYAGDELLREIRNASEKAFVDGVARAFPAIAVTNLSVRRAVPLRREAIDLVVIDEASQCDIASALPMLHRGKRALVIGDPNQLTHIANLHPSEDARLLESNEMAVDERRFSYIDNSLFDLARTTVGSGSRFIPLVEHYRSKGEIIDFSNREFYQSNLTVHTDYRNLPSSDSSHPVKWHNVEGNTIRPQNGSAHNEAEAYKVVAVLQQIIEMARAQGHYPSIGVVTPFRAQANRIRSLVTNMVRSKHLSSLEFLVDTAHSYQGDEKDFVIFSPVVSRNAPDTSLRFLSNDSNLFNVAITRARSELHVVGDMAACANSGIRYLSNFVRYVKELETPPDSSGAMDIFESPWEKVFFDALAEAGIASIPQYRFDQYKPDLAVPDSMIDIEVDGEYWHRNLDGSRVLSDLKRDTHLSSRGWQIKRFWVYELQSDLDRCVREVKEAIEHSKRK